jgi:hypothetical protein
MLRLFKWFIEGFLAGGFIIQRGWGCRGCLISFFWFIGIGYLLMFLAPMRLPEIEMIIPRTVQLGIAIFFIAIAIILSKAFSVKKDTFHGRNRPE